MRDDIIALLIITLGCVLFVVASIAGPLYYFDPGTFYQKPPRAIAEAQQSSTCMWQPYGDPCRDLLKMAITNYCFSPLPNSAAIMHTRRCFVRNPMTGNWDRKAWLDGVAYAMRTY